MAAPLDWTVAIDDGLTNRLHRCTQCGSTSGEGWYDIAEYPTLTIAFIQCARCRASDPQREAIDALLRQRYRLGKESV